MGEEEGFLEIADIKFMISQHLTQFPQFGKYLNYLKKTSVDKEFAICTFTGLYLFNVNYTPSKQSITQPHEVYYEGLNISAFDEIDSTRLAVAAAEQAFVGIIDRETQKETQRITIPNFYGVIKPSFP